MLYAWKMPERPALQNRTFWYRHFTTTSKCTPLQSVRPALRACLALFPLRDFSSFRQNPPWQLLRNCIRLSLFCRSRPRCGRGLGYFCGRKPCALSGCGAFYPTAVLLDRTGGASTLAGAAIHADISVNHELVAVSLDGVHGAGILAGTAADTDFFVNLVSHNMYLHTSIEICRPFCIIDKSHQITLYHRLCENQTVFHGNRGYFFINGPGCGESCRNRLPTDEFCYTIQPCDTFALWFIECI